jgi:uncharacterized hydrophobic protein (TIGR00271 family)
VKRILNSFRLFDEKEKHDIVIEHISKGVAFKGTNLWILIFAIFIASLGLNVNSTAVIIGAMLISPLMGPIMGMGLSLGINDLPLLRKSLQNYLLAVSISLGTSTLYFLISPINEAHSEILARTQPNIYDVLIALFGGFAGILAASSKQKGNVIIGVAIATALMPPLCTAGYGLATLQWKFFGGAFYLFLINTVFIALSTLVTVRYLKFPVHHLLDRKKETRSRRIVWAISILTIAPSIFFGYAFIQDNRFKEKANRFIEKETRITDDYLLNKKIDAARREITLTYGGAKIEQESLDSLYGKFKAYGFDSRASLVIKQGFSYLEQNGLQTVTEEGISQKDIAIVKLQGKVDSMATFDKLGESIFREIKVNYPSINSLALDQTIFYMDSSNRHLPICVITSKPKLAARDLTQIKQWLKVRLQVDSIALVY